MARLAVIAVALVFGAGTVNAQAPCCEPDLYDLDDGCCPGSPELISELCCCELAPADTALAPYDFSPPTAPVAATPARSTPIARAPRSAPPRPWRRARPRDRGDPIFLRNRALLL